MFYVYVLLCRDKRTYIGGTNDLKDRMKMHSLGRVDATKKRLPVKLYAYFAFQDEHKAFLFEQYFKTGSGRAFMKKHFFANMEV